MSENRYRCGISIPKLVVNGVKSHFGHQAYLNILECILCVYMLSINWLFKGQYRHDQQGMALEC